MASIGRMTYRSIQDAGEYKEEDAVVDLDVDGEACATHWRPDNLLQEAGNAAHHQSSHQRKLR